METTFKSNWLPIFAGGLLVVVGGIVQEDFRETSDGCGFSRQSVACQPATLPSADLPHPDHAPAIPSTITVTVSSTTATSMSNRTSPSTTVIGSTRAWPQLDAR